jgi:hypothetical protein
MEHGEGTTLLHAPCSLLSRTTVIVFLIGKALPSFKVLRESDVIDGSGGQENNRQGRQERQTRHETIAVFLGVLGGYFGRNLCDGEAADLVECKGARAPKGGARG